MDISKKSLRESIDEVLAEELPDHTDKARETVVEALLDRLEQDFEVLDDEEDDEAAEDEQEELDFE